MPVEVSELLHVLAHELRTPVGIAHGYVRLLLEDRITNEQDRRRALEQTQKALARLSDLSNQTSNLASWYEEEPPAPGDRALALEIVRRVSTAAFEYPVNVFAPELSERLVMRTASAPAVADALTAVIRATARELRGQPCDVRVTADDGRLQMFAAPPDQMATLQAGPGAPGAGPLVLDRGGIGLSLLHAAAILDAHGAERWATRGLRQTAAVRLPLERIS